MVQPLQPPQPPYNQDNVCYNHYTTATTIMQPVAIMYGKTIIQLPQP